MEKTIKIEIKNRWTGSVLFEYESEDNTIKRTVEEALNSGADLGGGIKLLAGNSIFRISDVGSRMGTTFAYNTDKGIYVQCGCFFGTLDEFAAKVEQTHGDNQHGKVYKAIYVTGMD